MRRRMGRPGLVGTMARTAVVAGTATAVVGGMRERKQASAQQQAQETANIEADAAKEAQAMQAQAMQAGAAQTQQRAAPAGGDNTIAQLEKLAQMKSAGVLDDAEFTAAKAKLLGI